VRRAQGAIKFNGGGHVNHSIFWTNLCAPKAFVDPADASPELAKAPAPRPAARPLPPVPVPAGARAHAACAL
jgi:hypothetical protein